MVNNGINSYNASFWYRYSLEANKQNTETPHFNDLVQHDPQGTQCHNFQSLMHNSSYTCQVRKCFKQKLKYIKFSTKKVLIIFQLEVTGVKINNVEVTDASCAVPILHASSDMVEI